MAQRGRVKWVVQWKMKLPLHFVWIVLTLKRKEINFCLLIIRLLLIVLCHRASFYFRLTTRVFSFLVLGGRSGEVVVFLAENKVLLFLFQVPAPVRRHRNLILRLRHSKHSWSTNVWQKKKEKERWVWWWCSVFFYSHQTGTKGHIFTTINHRAPHQATFFESKLNRSKSLSSSTFFVRQVKLIYLSHE